ncbi:hypothetical protein ACWF9B_24885 [Streptomyces sp. NPDC055089]
MLHALGPAEREALLAHGRAHLAGRHHLHPAAELSARCHPAPRALRASSGHALERCADKASRTRWGPQVRAVIRRAALAARTAGEPSVPRPAACCRAARPVRRPPARRTSRRGPAGLPGGVGSSRSRRHIRPAHRHRDRAGSEPVGAGPAPADGRSVCPPNPVRFPRMTSRRVCCPGYTHPMGSYYFFR